MLEIILIVLISKKIAAQLREKGRSPGGYVALFVVLWIGCEILGAIVGVVITMAQNPPGLQDLIIYFFGLAGAAIGGTIGYLIASLVPPIEEPPWEDYDDEDEDRYRERRRRHRPPDDGSFEEH